MIPTELQALIDDVDAAEQEARGLVRGLDDRQVNWQPGGGKAWSIAQCRTTSRASTGSTSRPCCRAGGGGRRPSRSARCPVDRTQVRRLKDRSDATAQGAERTMTPACQLPVATCWPALWLATRYRELVRLCRDSSNRVRMPTRSSSGPGCESRPSARDQHEQRHIWQARNQLALTAHPEEAI
jgi:hypothetical protein